MVGCPRSGTTLAQAMLAGHPKVFTFPETHFFQKIQGRLRPEAPLVSPRAAARSLDHIRNTLGSPVAQRRPPRWWLGLGAYASAFQEVVDAAAGNQSCEVWLEKSPVHLHHLETITRYDKSAGIIHVMRDGRDVVASLVDLGLRDPEHWVSQLLGRGARNWARADLIRGAVARWNRDIGITISYRDRHPLQEWVIYEQLVESPATVLARACQLMGLEYHPDMERPWERADEVVGWRRSLPHMDRVFRPIERTPLQKFSSLFTDEEQGEITTALTHGGDPEAALAAPR
jgi:hypothetical protein